MGKRIGIKQIWLILFFIGLASGAFFANIIIKANPSFSSQITVDLFDKNQLNLISNQELFVFILLKRIKQLGIFFIFMMLLNASIVIGVTVMGFSFSLGMLFAFETMRMGLQGMIITIACFLPHYILYIGAFCLIATGVAKSQKSVSDTNYVSSSSRKNRKQILVWCGLLTIFVSGCFLEAYINPIILKIF